MNSKITFACCIATLLLSTQLHAQRIPVGALPTQYNGGFAGEAGALRLSSFSFARYRHVQDAPRELSLNRWTSGSFISVDHFVKKLRSGVGFTVGRRGDDDGRFMSNSMSLAVSPKFSFKGKFTFAPFANFSFEKYKVNYGWPVTFPSGYITDHHEGNNFNIKTGFLVNSDKAYVGVSAEVMRYSKSSIENEASLRFLSQLKYNFQAGYTFQQTPESDFSFTPQLVVSYDRFIYTNPYTLKQERRNVITLVDLNLMCRYKKFISGVNSNGLVLGYQSSRFKVQITNFYMNRERKPIGREVSDNTYFMVRSYEEGMNKYSGNISLRYIFKKNIPLKTQSF